MSAVADGVGCARLRRAGEGAARERESGEQRSGQRRETAERRGARAAERDSIADGTALRCGRVGSRHFESSKFMLGALFVCDAIYSPSHWGPREFLILGESGAHPSIYSLNVVWAHRRG